MYNEDLKQKLHTWFNGKSSIIIVQGDNPDGDSLATSLALEALLTDQGKKVSLYCSIDMGRHLRYLNGWDRVAHDIPVNFDAWILVDCEYTLLLENAKNNGILHSLRTKPLLIIDHHASPSDIDFAEITVNDPSAGSTGHVVYNIAKLLEWNISIDTAEFIAVSIMSDTLGFQSDVTTNNSSPLRVVAELIDQGISLASLNERRVAQFKISPDIFRYKTELMQRVEFHYNYKIATLEIPHEEIKEFSMDYNPTVVLDETRMIDGLAVTIGIKSYERNGNIYKVTGRIRCNYGYTFAAELAAHFKDGGGHPYAAGFKIEGSNLSIAVIKKQVIEKAIELIG